MKNILFILGVIIITGFAINAPLNSLAGSGKHKPAPQPFTITGDIANMPPHMVVLEMLRANDSITIVDSQNSNTAGHFEIKGTLTEPGLYRIRFRDQQFVLLSLDKGTTTIQATWPLADYSIGGSVPSIQLKSFIDTVRYYMMLVNTGAARLDSLKKTGNMDLVNGHTKMLQDINLIFINKVKQYSDTTPYQPNAVLSSRIVNPKGEMEYFESFTKNMERRFPGTTMTRDYRQFLEQLKASMPASTEIGSEAPELKLDDVNGKSVTLSSFRGKYVLVDFWASWCGPCRAENPNVLAAYNKFKNKNFTILGVSLDNKKELWQKAIDKDGLPWQQISDLKGWQSGAAAKYGVQSIPMNFLVDPKGIIIGKNLRGPDLEKKLEEAIK